MFNRQQGSRKSFGGLNPSSMVSHCTSIFENLGWASANEWKGDVDLCVSCRRVCVSFGAVRSCTGIITSHAHSAPRGAIISTGWMRTDSSHPAVHQDSNLAGPRLFRCSLRVHRVERRCTETWVRAVRAARWAVSKFTQQQHLSTRCAVYGCDDVHCERAQPCFMRDVACARVWMAALGLGLEWRRCTLLECSRPASIRLGSAPDADCLKATGKT